MTLEPVIILSHPQLGENIGACARVMCNFGLKTLRIINPRDGWPNPKAVDMAKGAKHLLDHAQIVSSLADALTDIHLLYATTVRPRDMVKPTITPKQIGSIISSHPGKRIAFLFGPERTGLTNDEISLADAILTIPVGEEYGSLNLAQAVAITAYEYFSHYHSSPHSSSPTLASSNATKAELDGFLAQLEEALTLSNFFQVPEKKPKMMQNIRNIFSRHSLTEQEIRTLRGIIKALQSST